MSHYHIITSILRIVLPSTALVAVMSLTAHAHTHTHVRSFHTIVMHQQLCSLNCCAFSQSRMNETDLVRACASYSKQDALKMPFTHTHTLVSSTRLLKFAVFSAPGYRHMHCMASAPATDMLGQGFRCTAIRCT